MGEVKDLCVINVQNFQKAQISVISIKEFEVP